jgi:transposase
MERQRRSFTDEYKRQTVELVLSSGRSVISVAKELGLRDSVLRRWLEKLGREPASATRRPATQATPPSADQAAEIARLRQENERLRGARHFKKPSWAMARLCAVETANAIFSAWRVAAVSLLEAQSPLKNVVHGCMRT